ncbi:MAG: SprT family zinc-dependent metalloprotease [bacterium]
MSGLELNNPECVLLRRQVKYARLRVRSNGVLEVVAPHGMGAAQLAEFIGSKRAWIETRRAYFLKQAAAAAFDPGSLELHGRRLRIEYSPARGRYADVDEAVGTVSSGLDLAHPAKRAVWMQAYARRFLELRLDALARLHGFVFARASIRNQRSRWGSCSSRGTISLNWHLVQAPHFVVDYLLLHELAHTRFMNHGARYWELVHSLCPEHRAAKVWLRAHSPG